MENLNPISREVGRGSYQTTQTTVFTAGGGTPPPAHTPHRRATSSTGGFSEDWWKYVLAMLATAALVYALMSAMASGASSVAPTPQVVVLDDATKGIIQDTNKKVSQVKTIISDTNKKVTTIKKCMTCGKSSNIPPPKQPSSAYVSSDATGKVMAPVGFTGTIAQSVSPITINGDSNTVVIGNHNAVGGGMIDNSVTTRYTSSTSMLSDGSGVLPPAPGQPGGVSSQAYVYDDAVYIPQHPVGVVSDISLSRKIGNTLQDVDAALSLYDRFFGNKGGRGFRPTGGGGAWHQDDRRGNRGGSERPPTYNGPGRGGR